jgi:flavin reductase (DIM6/NTAB) family NADH-FMN oxidoreductase RutF
VFYEPQSRDRAVLPYDPFKALVAPRPIGWVTTISRTGAVNLAPYSFFNALCSDPPILGFASEGPKDSVTFARETGEFVWNLPTYDLRAAMNATSAPLPRGTSEFGHAGLAAAPSRLVKPPRVAASPCAMECRVLDIVELKDLSGRPLGTYLVTGQVIGIHLDESVIVDGRVDTAAIRPIARCGYADYAIGDHLFSMQRPGPES